eukprot:TRINITY_DN6546_c0_g2_i1.p1 TRINITY_DN6546_c0_g2~~TRINITY_DN6546_c0_g2_i1.p1  ORF type:complete len:318 (+),score=26.02 TRINITY_DN6546_c0_g2_i1:149-1102(+)
MSFSRASLGRRMTSRLWTPAATVRPARRNLPSVAKFRSPAVSVWSTWRSFTASSVSAHKPHSHSSTTSSSSSSSNSPFSYGADSVFNTATAFEKLIPPLTSVQRAIMGAGAALVAFADPTRADMVATLGETTGTCALNYMREEMAKNHTGRRILEDRPRVRSPEIDLEAIRSLPVGTFGRAYADWMGVRGFTPEERPEVKLIDDPELAYVMTRFRESHDFWHVLLGLRTDVTSEIAVKWFEMLQMRLPVCALSALVGPLRVSSEERHHLMTELVPWAVRCSLRAPFLLNVYYEQHFEEDLTDMRRRLRIVPPPYGWS